MKKNYSQRYKFYKINHYFPIQIILINFYKTPRDANPSMAPIPNM